MGLEALEIFKELGNKRLQVSALCGPIDSTRLDSS